MVITRKHDGSPRRTVDLSPLNKFCKRETHAFEAPFHLARRVPRNTWKTVRDAWNGYHSVPLQLILIDTSPPSLHHLRNGDIQEHRKVSCRPETGTTADLVLLSPISCVKNAGSMIQFFMMIVYNSTGGAPLNS